MKTSFLFKTFISTIVAFGIMSKYLFDQYSEMALAGHAYDHGIEAGMSDAFLYFLAAVVLGGVVWFASMLALSFIERLINKRTSEKRKAKKEADTDEVFHD